MGQSLSFCRAMLKLLILGVTCAGVSYAYFCQPCDSFPCQTSTCCESGEYETPNCGCCLQCAPLRGKSDNPRRAVDQFGYDLTPKKSNIPVPVCSTEEKNTCRCTSSSVIGPDGKTKGGCVSSRSPPTGCVEGANHGWCFLENVKNPLNGSENCFEDTSWSAVDGRFWSKMACTKEFRKKNCKEKEKITLEDIILPELEPLHLKDLELRPIETCPERRPDFNERCQYGHQGLTCSYGSQTCCGKTSPEVTLSCMNSVDGWMWSGYFLDTVCMLGGECPDESTTTSPGCDCPLEDKEQSVCGSDGVTYSSACRAHCVGAQIYHEGVCLQKIASSLEKKLLPNLSLE